MKVSIMYKTARIHGLIANGFQPGSTREKCVTTVCLEATLKDSEKRLIVLIQQVRVGAEVPKDAPSRKNPGEQPNHLSIQRSSSSSPAG
jgi:hypothetical protein